MVIHRYRQQSGSAASACLCKTVGDCMLTVAEFPIVFINTGTSSSLPFDAPRSQLFLLQLYPPPLLCIHLCTRSPAQAWISCSNDPQAVLRRSVGNVHSPRCAMRVRAPQLYGLLAAKITCRSSSPRVLRLTRILARSIL